jgi:hypothetical protein
VPTLLTAPDGGLLYDDNVQPPNDPSGTLVYYGADSPSIGAFTLPNTTPMLAAVQEGGGFAPGGFAPGSWSFTVNDFALECTTTAACDAPSQARRRPREPLTSLSIWSAPTGSPAHLRREIHTSSEWCKRLGRSSTMPAFTLER